MLEAIPSELRALGLAAEVDLEANCRLQPLAELFEIARRARRWSIARAARETDTPQRLIKAIEHADPSRLDPDPLVVYATRLGTSHLLAEWITANPRLAETLRLPGEEGLLARAREILMEDARRVALVPHALARVTPPRFEAPPGYAAHLHPDSVEARLAGVRVASGGGSPDPGAPPVALPATPAPPAIYQFHVELHHMDPPVWRRIRVSNAITFAELHDILQIAMGWENRHLHAFTWRRVEIGLPDPEWSHGVLDGTRLRLADLGLRARAKLGYLYDFGDDWDHTLRLEKILPLAENPAPVCLEGAGTCPPEDCGGPYGYDHILKILENPEVRSDEDRELLDWVGPGFDPKSFSIEPINRALARVAAASRRRARTRPQRKSPPPSDPPFPF